MRDHLLYEAERRAYTQLRSAHDNQGQGDPVRSWRI
jgi:hypothetical protein